MHRGAVALGLGAVAGFTGGLFGVGGGIIMVPGMVVLLAVPQGRAHATSITSMIAASAAAVIPLALGDRVHWPAAAALVAGSMAGAFGGARLVGRLSDIWLARAFLVLILAAAIRMILTGGIAGESTTTAAAVDLGAPAVGLVGIGLVAGALAALLGIGGGLIFVPALVALFAFPQHVAQATSLAVIVPTAIVAALTHARAGRIDWPLAAALAAGGLLGGFLGAVLSLDVAPSLLRRMLAVLLVLAGIRMVARTIAARSRLSPR